MLALIKPPTTAPKSEPKVLTKSQTIKSKTNAKHQEHKKNKNSFNKMIKFFRQRARNVNKLYEQSRKQMKYAKMLRNFNEEQDAEIAAEDSVRTLERCVELDPSHVRSLISLADASMERDPMRAIELYRRAISCSKEFMPDAQLALACALRKVHKYAEAKEEFENIIFLSTTKRQVKSEARGLAYLNLGVIHYAEGLIEEAAWDFEQAVLADPKGIRIPLSIACHYHGKDDDKCIEYCKKALKQKPYYVMVNQMLVTLYYQKFSQMPGHSQRKEAETYLGCILRLYQTSDKQIDIDVCEEHLNNFQFHSQSTWNLWQEKGDQYFVDRI